LRGYRYAVIGRVRSGYGARRAPDFTFVHRLPKGRPVDRREFVKGLAAGKTVVDVGFVDYPLLEERLTADQWLHADLAEVARRIVGIDLDTAGVDWARRHGYTAYAADIQKPDAIAALGLERAELLTACEVIEHLDSPGGFLEAAKQLSSTIVLTTPNGYRLMNTIAALVGREVIHPEHTALHTPQTLKRLLSMHGWELTEIRYYRETPSKPHDGLRHSLAIRAVNLFERGQSAIPRLAAGLIAVAQLPPRTSDPTRP
jgi:2-polyprenyl-3-methyl-5-hydroxy-6-metoxy-1,4-benzoquinol methylase